ncbi:hypothetical protein GQ44DRAFT_723757 [Phaeosphaeriaceae sp. PMI808]|nr:hypothetical protein GQ44DRAFT_723757 [Phaeosphaeriaceae sp. PMI808]
MNTFIVVLTCALAVFIPILSAQLISSDTTESEEGDGGSVSVISSTRSNTDSSDAHIKSSRCVAKESPRKPWDPPFPSSSKTRKENDWLVLRKLSPRKFTQNGGDEEHEETTGDMDAPPITTDGQPHDNKKWYKPVISVIWNIVGVLAGILLVLLSIALVIYCLAWFIVYHTEARLGEARRGLVKGGEMRLCLCSRG